MNFSTVQNLLLRLAVADDADTLTQITIAAKSHWKYPDSWIERWLPQLTISSEYVAANETWAATVNDQLVAYYSLHEESGELWLDNLWVLPDFIGHGLGGELFNHARHQARARGFNLLKLEADPNAVGFYEHMGAHKIGERDRGEIDGQRRVLPIMQIEV